MPLSRPLPRGPNALLSSAVSQDPGRASHTQGSPRRRGPACCSHSLPPPPCPLALARDRPLRECHVAALITNPHRGRSWRGGTPGHVTTSVKDAPVPPAALAPRVSAHLGLRPSGERWPCRRSRNPVLASFSHLRSNFLTFPP